MASSSTLKIIETSHPFFGSRDRCSCEKGAKLLNKRRHVGGAKLSEASEQVLLVDWIPAALYHWMSDSIDSKGFVNGFQSYCRRGLGLETTFSSGFCMLSSLPYLLHQLSNQACISATTLHAHPRITRSVGGWRNLSKMYSSLLVHALQLSSKLLLLKQSFS